MQEAASQRGPSGREVWAGDADAGAKQQFALSDFLGYSPLITAAVDGLKSTVGSETHGLVGPRTVPHGGVTQERNHTNQMSNGRRGPATNLASTTGGAGSSLVSGMKKLGEMGADLMAKPDTGPGGAALNGPAKLPFPKIDERNDQPNVQPLEPPADNSWLPALNAVNDAAPKVYSEQSGVALGAGRYEDAAKMARGALSLNPKDKNAMFVLASARGRTNALTASAASGAVASGGAAAMKPSDRDAGEGGRRGAGEDRGRPGEIAGGHPAAVVHRAATIESLKVASTALRLGDAEGALRSLDKALERDPKSPELLGLRAQTYGRLGRWEEALKDATAALESAPGNMGLLRTKAIAENRTHRWREALATSEQMIALDPGNAWGYANRAHAWGGLGNGEAMMSDIKRAASLDGAFQAAADEAAKLQLPSDSDVMFLFPGEGKAGTQSPASSAGRGRSFSVVLGAAIGGGFLLALGLLSMVLRPIKDAVVSSFTKVQRHGPTVGAIPTAEPASVAGDIGGVIRGQYQIKRKIGEGGMGMVFEGTDRSLGRRVAIKKMRDELRLNPRERDRFVIEAKTVASLHHANIVDIYAIAEEGEDVYLVFEYVEGKTVHDIVQSKGRLAPLEAVSVTRSMGEALSYAHSKGVIHRDMKPSNVMLSSMGEIKVMDFGIARMAKDALTRYSMTQNVVGTPPYMAPEQEQGVVRKESDVYALAICAYEMLTGKLPFIGMGAGMLMNKLNMSYIPPARAIAGLPEALDEVFVKAFQADPDQRYRTPQEFVSALAAAADGARSKKA